MGILATLDAVFMKDIKAIDHSVSTGHGSTSTSGNRNENESNSNRIISFCLIFVVVK
jgi:hypothetical protein